MSIAKKENPFASYDPGINYTKFISDQVEDMGVGNDEAIILDIGEKEIESARMTLRYIGRKTKFKFSTKTFKGDLWVMKYPV